MQRDSNDIEAKKTAQLKENESESSMGLSMAPPPFQLTASGSGAGVNPPIQQKATSSEGVVQCNMMDLHGSTDPIRGRTAMPREEIIEIQQRLIDIGLLEESHEGTGWNRGSIADDNTYVGAFCGYSNRQGIYNTGMGTYADFGSTQESYSTFIGAYIYVKANYATVLGALARAEDDGSNVIGYDAESDAKNAEVVGYQAYLSSAADFSQGIGRQCSVSVDSSTAIGREAIISGANSLSIGYQSFATSSESVVLGYQSSSDSEYGIALGASSSVTGNQSIAIGGTSSITDTVENAIAIGYGTNVSTANKISLGNSATTNIGGVVNWTATSDGRFKKEVRADIPGMEFLNKLRPVTYVLDPFEVEKVQGREVPDGLEEFFLDKLAYRYTGFIAQEVEQAANESGFAFSGVVTPQNEKDAYGIRYAEFVVPLVKGIQELDQKSENQDQLIQHQQAQLLCYKERKMQLLKKLSQLEARMEQKSLQGTLSQAR